MSLLNQSIVKKAYVVEGTSNGSITTRGDIIFGGGKVGNVYRHLEGVNKRPLGLASSQRVQNSLCLLTKPGYNANKTCVSSRAGSLNEGAQITVGEGSNSPSDKQPGRFLLKPLLGAQEEQSDEASNQPETVERVSSHKMEGVSTLKDILQSGDWFVKVDLKDAYFTIPIDSGHQQYLRFMQEGENYQFTCFLFSLSCAPRTFTKVLKPVMILLGHGGSG